MLNTDFEHLRELYLSLDRPNIRKEVIEIVKGLKKDDHYNQIFYHPLGFIYTTLHTFPNEETIRLHVWSKKHYDIEPRLDIHNHYYRVNSYVFSGCVVNQLYKVHHENHSNVTQYKGSYTNDGDRVLTKTNDGLFVIEDVESIHCAGELYSIGHDQIHSGGVVGNDLTCTLVYTQDPGEKIPLVFGKGDLPEVLNFKQVLVPKGDVESIIKELSKVS
ncbi:hypothetical protein [Pedobacter jejuensis]|uniref:Uncharacterized protein n=1 Tax=Pedobacter jejuensis TaxID=1268550 RepID=A0A3N0BUN1_9SPHI|nr:hypothetical protein [Pedobacter jejuensis]RNL53008.1 hypothetical protein D7004_10620 [Pedobacter jejuensis]